MHWEISLVHLGISSMQWEYIICALGVFSELGNIISVSGVVQCIGNLSSMH